MTGLAVRAAGTRRSAPAVATGALLVLRLTTARSRAAAVIGASVLALAAGPWSTALLAVLVGIAIAWGRFATRRRVTAAVGSLLLLWIVPAGITAVTSAAGSRVLLPHPAELLSYARQVLGAAASLPGAVLPPLLLALAVAIAGAVSWRLLARARPPGRA